MNTADFKNKNKTFFLNFISIVHKTKAQFIKSLAEALTAKAARIRNQLTESQVHLHTKPHASAQSGFSSLAKSRQKTPG